MERERPQGPQSSERDVAPDARRQARAPMRRQGPDTVYPSISSEHAFRARPGDGARRRRAYSSVFTWRVRSAIPAATFSPVVPSMLRGCNEMLEVEPPTSPLAASPTTTAAPAVSPP